MIDIKILPKEITDELLKKCGKFLRDNFEKYPQLGFTFQMFYWDTALGKEMIKLRETGLALSKKEAGYFVKFDGEKVVEVDD